VAKCSFDVDFLQNQGDLITSLLPLWGQLGRMRLNIHEVGLEMNNFFLLVIGALFIILAGFLIFYFQIQQNFQEITDKLKEIQDPQKGSRASDSFRRDLAFHHDKLVVLEADITKNKRESLTEEELKTFDVARQHIKASIAGLKTNGDWVGMPFEYEWAEMLDRLPNVLNLYRKAEAERKALELAQTQGQQISAQPLGEPAIRS
jgi:hypothetical protein